MPCERRTTVELLAIFPAHSGPRHTMPNVLFVPIIMRLWPLLIS